jgi:uncharacterized membrane protein YGL010W
MNFEQLPNHDLVLRTAKKRVAFKKHLTIYILLNLLLWVLYFFLFRKSEDKMFLHSVLFVFIAWTIIVIGHYFFAVRWNKTMLEKEIETLIKENTKQETGNSL